MSHRTIEFTPRKLKSFKKVLATAQAEAQDSFMFEGNQFLVSYAKYLVEYLNVRMTGSILDSQRVETKS